MAATCSQPSATQIDLDPLHADTRLCLHGTYHPMGYPVEIATNSQDILDAAEEAWSCYTTAEAGRRVRLDIGVRDGDTSLSSHSTVLSREHLLSFIAGPNDFVVCDLRSRYGFGWLTPAMAGNHAYSRYHFVEPAAYVLLEAAALTPVHASCVALHGRALLLCGDSGSGKTTLAYACARRGWTYLADDATHIVRRPLTHTVVGRPYSIRFRETARKTFPELERFAAALRPNGKVDYELATDRLGISVGERAEAVGVVFLKRSVGRKLARCRAFAVEEAQQRLEAVIGFGDEALRREQRGAVSHLLTRAVLELEYDDLDSAETVLRAYVR